MSTLTPLPASLAGDFAFVRPGPSGPSGGLRATLHVVRLVYTFSARIWVIPVLAQTPGRDLSNTKGSVQRPELNLWFWFSIKVQLASRLTLSTLLILVTEHKHLDRR